MKFLITSTFLFLFFNTSLLKASETVTVTSSKIPTNSSDELSSYQVIRNLDSSVIDDLNQQSFIQINRSGHFGGNTSLYLRGVDSGFIKYVYDGVEIFDPSDIENAVQLNHFGSSDLDNIEILKGSQGHLYGSQALGGVINFNSKRINNDRTAYVGVGSYETKKIGASISHYNKNKKSGIFLSTDYLKTNGISSFNEKRTVFAETDPYKRLNGTIKYEKKINKLKIKAFAKLISTDLDIDNSGSDLRLNDQSTYSQDIYSLQFKYPFLKYGPTELVLSQNEITRNSLGNRYKGEVSQINLRQNLFWKEDSKSFVGIDFQNQTSKDPSVTEKKDEVVYALTLSHKEKIKNLLVDISARADRYDSFGLKESLGLGIGYKFNKLMIKSNISSSFKAATPYQLYSNFGNTDLKPTSFYSVDIGTVYEIKNFKFETSLFKNSFDDKIDFSNNRYVNIGKVDIVGGEVMGSFNVEKFSNSFMYTHLYTRDFLNNKTLARRPRHNFKASQSYDFKRMKVALYEHVQGERDDSGRMPMFLTVDLKLQYKINSDNNLNLEMNNLLDREYEEVRTYGTPGRNFALTLRSNI